MVLKVLFLYVKQLPGKYSWRLFRFWMEVFGRRQMASHEEEQEEKEENDADDKEVEEEDDD